MEVLLAPPKGNIELKSYLEWLSSYGFTPIILEPRIQQIYLPLILCGGADIGKNLTRDSLEYHWIQNALSNNQPIIGICRGMQILNSYFDGLVEDLPELIEEDHTCDVFTDDNDHAHRLSNFHFVIDRYGNAMKVNSRHHQYCSEIAPNFKVTHTSFGGDVVEAFEDVEHKIWAVQWHPERSESDDNQYPLNKLKELYF